MHIIVLEFRNAKSEKKAFKDSKELLLQELQLKLTKGRKDNSKPATLHAIIKTYY